MIEIIIHATGSKGNAYSIIDGDQKILIDPGINFKALQKATDFKLCDYDFVLVSHEHKDHCQSIKQLSKLGLNCLMSDGTANAIDMQDVYTNIKAEVQIKRKSWNILPFETQHDAKEPLGFLILSPSGKKILYATDTYYIKYRFTGVNYWMIEANYSEKLLSQNSELPRDTKSRIRTSHFEIENLKDFFKKQDVSKTEKIFLIHLSDDNSDQEYFLNSILEVTGKTVII